MMLTKPLRLAQRQFQENIMNTTTATHNPAAEATRAAATARRIVARAIARPANRAWAGSAAAGFDLQETPNCAPEYAARNALGMARKAARCARVAHAVNHPGMFLYDAARAAAYSQKYARIAAEHACQGAALV